MRLLLKLTFANLWRNPVRSILTLVAMIAAASVVSWLVAGYDSMFDQFNDDPDLIKDRAELMFIAYEGTPYGIDSVQPSFETLQLDSRYAMFFSSATRVNAQKKGGIRASRGRATSPVRPENMQATDSNLKSIAPLITSTTPQLPAQSQQPQNLLSIVANSQEIAGGPRRGGGRGRPSQGALAPVVYGLPTGGGVPLQGVNAAIPPYPMANGTWDKIYTDTSAVVLTESIAERFQVKLGDEIEIASNAGFFTFNVVGVMSDGVNAQKYHLLSSDTPLMDVTSSSGIFTNWEWAEKVAGGKLHATSAIVNTPPHQNIADIISSCRSPENSHAFYMTQQSQLLEVMQKRVDDGGRRNLSQAYSATAISMLVSFFIIFTTLSMGVDERIRQLAILRIVAFSRRQIAGMILLESLFYGILGWLGGLLSGYILLYILQWMGNSDVQMKIGFWTILLTGICSLVGALIASVLPMIRAVRIRPIEAMMPMANARPPHTSWRVAVLGLFLLAVNPMVVSVDWFDEDYAMMAYVGGCVAMVIGFVCMAPVMTVLCEKIFAGILARLLGIHPMFLRSQLRANLWRTVGTVISLSIGLGFFMMILIWSASMMIPFVSGQWMPDMFVSVVPGGLNEESVNEVKQLQGVESTQCEPIAIEQVRLAKDLTRSAIRQSIVRQDNIVMCGVAFHSIFEENALFPFEFVSDKQTAEKMMKNELMACLIPDYFAHAAWIEENGVARHLKVGDCLEVLTLEKNPQVVVFKVAGIIRMQGWHWFSKISGTRRNFTRTAAMVFTSHDAMKYAFNLHRTNYLWMNVSEDLQTEKLQKSIEHIAMKNRGESFHVLGMGESVVGRETVRLTSKKALNQSLVGRSNMMIDGMLRIPLLILLVVSISVANTAFASIRSRKGEIGIMRAVGLTRWGLFRLVLAEAIMIAIVATVMSLLFGVGSGLCSAQFAAHSHFFGGMGWAFDIPWSRIIEGSIFTLILCLIASMIPAIWAARTSPLTLLQEGSSEN